MTRTVPFSRMSSRERRLQRLYSMTDLICLNLFYFRPHSAFQNLVDLDVIKRDIVSLEIKPVGVSY